MSTINYDFPFTSISHLLSFVDRDAPSLAIQVIRLPDVLLLLILSSPKPPITFHDETNYAIATNKNHPFSPLFVQFKLNVMRHHIGYWIKQDQSNKNQHLFQKK